MRVKVFISYARADQELNKKLLEHLSPLERSEKVSIWQDQEIKPGDNWDESIQARLKDADLILLLVSASFIASEYCWNKEVQKALQRQQAGTVKVIPIVLKPAYWQDTPLGQIQALPTGAKPITQWENQDAAFEDVVRGIRKVVEDFPLPEASHWRSTRSSSSSLVSSGPSGVASSPPQRSTTPPLPPKPVRSQRRLLPIKIATVMRIIIIGLILLLPTLILRSSTPPLLVGHNWTLQNDMNIQRRNLGSVIWADSQFVAVGEGAILTSPDGNTWTYTPSMEELSSVVWSGSQFVAVGSPAIGDVITSSIITSPDGHTWSAPHAITTQPLNGLAWSGSQFVAVGGENYGSNRPGSSIILTSPDGVTWTVQHANASQVLLSVTWGGSQFVAVGYGGTILTSPDGRTWTVQHATTTQNLNSVTWSGRQFLAVGAGGTFLTSLDGHVWTVYSGSGVIFYGVVWAGSQFVIVGSGGNFLTSSDGSTWSGQYIPGVDYLSSVAGSGTQFVAVGYNGTIVTSPDGRTWTTATKQDLYKVAWEASQFMALGKDGTILTSFDGQHWIAQYTGTVQALRDVAWSGKQFVAVGGNRAITTPNEDLITPGGSVILTSPDGSAWTTQHTDTTQTLWGVVWSGRQFVAVGSDVATANTTSEGVTVTPVSNIILTSPDGHTWTTQYVGSGQYLWSIAWSGKQFVAVGGDNIMTSPDGHTWTTQHGGIGHNLFSVAWSGSQFVAVGPGTILTSPDGRTWTAQHAGTGNYALFSVAWLGSQFVAVGVDEDLPSGGGAILTSPEGSIWTAQHTNTNTTPALSGVAWSDPLFLAVAVGVNGAILSSPY